MNAAEFLDVPGALLFYKLQGRGPLLLMIPGATGTASSFQTVAGYLAAHYTVLTYDRRGFSRSQLHGLQSEAHRLETDAADVRRLVEHLSDTPAILFGSSSGGIIALEVLTRHPAVVRMLVPFEPPAVRLLSDGQQWLDFFARVYRLYRQSGVEPALQVFREHAFAQVDRQVMADAVVHKNGEDRLANAAYWFEHELRQYPAVALDLDALRAHAARIMPATGRESRGYPCYRATMALGKTLGRGVIELPGGHIGHLSHPADFARDLHNALG